MNRARFDRLTLTGITVAAAVLAGSGLRMLLGLATPTDYGLGGLAAGVALVCIHVRRRFP